MNDSKKSKEPEGHELEINCVYEVFEDALVVKQCSDLCDFYKLGRVYACRFSYTFTDDEGVVINRPSKDCPLKCGATTCKIRYSRYLGAVHYDEIDDIKGLREKIELAGGKIEVGQTAIRIALPECGDAFDVPKTEPVAKMIYGYLDSLTEEKNDGK